jgi:hypothetical protein
MNESTYEYTITKWLVINKPRSRYSSKSIVKLASKKPTIRSNQIAIEVTVKVPEDIFETVSYNTSLQITKDMLPKKEIKTTIKRLVNV